MTLPRSVTGQELGEEVLYFVNQFGFDADSFAKTIAKGHKTLQQSTMRLFMRAIEEMAKVRPDQRNEQTVELAKKITELAKDYSLPLI